MPAGPDPTQSCFSLRTNAIIHKRNELVELPTEGLVSMPRGLIASFCAERGFQPESRELPALRLLRACRIGDSYERPSCAIPMVLVFSARKSPQGTSHSKTQWRRFRPCSEAGRASFASRDRRPYFALRVVRRQSFAQRPENRSFQMRQGSRRLPVLRSSSMCPFIQCRDGG